MPHSRGSTLAVPPASTTSKGPWPDSDVSAVAFRLHALGASERAARAFLDGLAASGVRRLRGYVDGISDADLSAYADRAEDAAKHASLEVEGRRGRGDLMVIRTPARWPWRVSTGTRVAGGGPDAA